jgi:hypothetical protein
MLIIDGQQRLPTLQHFYDGVFQGREFKLVDAQAQFKDRTYKTLEEGTDFAWTIQLSAQQYVKQDEPSEDEKAITLYPTI